jgi:hypothetical protein
VKDFGRRSFVDRFEDMSVLGGRAVRVVCAACRSGVRGRSGAVVNWRARRCGRAISGTAETANEESVPANSYVPKRLSPSDIEKLSDRCTASSLTSRF